MNWRGGADDLRISANLVSPSNFESVADKKALILNNVYMRILMTSGLLVSVSMIHYKYKLLFCNIIK